MITFRTVRQARTSRNIKSFRSCQYATGVSMAHFDRARFAREKERLAGREARRMWLTEQWDRHFERVAGPRRVLPPSART